MSKKKGSIFIPGLEEFININLIQRPDPIFNELEEYALRENIPIVSPMAGAALASWVKFHNPSSILEFGTGAGYSLHWLIAYSSSKLKIKTYERQESLMIEIKKFWNRSPYKDKADVDFVLGSVEKALETRQLKLSDFDLVFVDSDKVTYPEVFDRWLEDIEYPDNNFDGKRAILFDNALWHGRLLYPDPNKQSDIAVVNLWEKVKSSGLYYELNPSGDGILAVYAR